MDKQKIIAVTLAVCCMGSIAMANEQLTMRESVNRLLHPDNVDQSVQSSSVEDATSDNDEIQQLLEETRQARKQLEAMIENQKAAEKHYQDNRSKAEETQDFTADDNIQEPLVMRGDILQGYQFDDNYDSSVIYDVTPPPDDDAVRYDYDPGSTYQVYCRPGFTTDVQLQKGEKVLKITAGDKTNWEYRYMPANDGYHLYISPVQMGLETNLIIITDKHNYQLRLSTDKQFYPIVRWNYPQEYYEVQDEKNIVMEVKSVDQLDFNYSITQAESYPWTPETVFSDGFRTFIRMPQQQAEKYRPLLMIKKGGKWMLAQYAIKNNAIVVGEVFNEAMLMIGNADNRKIVRINKAG